MQEPSHAPGGFRVTSGVGLMNEPSVGVGDATDDPFDVNNIWSSGDNIRSQIRRMKMFVTFGTCRALLCFTEAGALIVLLPLPALQENYRYCRRGAAHHDLHVFGHDFQRRCNYSAGIIGAGKRRHRRVARARTTGPGHWLHA